LARGICYVPILKGKTGEYDAMRVDSSLVHDSATPLVEAQLKQGPRGVAGALQIADHLWRALGPKRPFYLDFARLDGHETIQVKRQPVSVIAHVFAECRSSKGAMHAIPVATAAMHPMRAQAIANAAASDEQGVCLRLKRDDFISASKQALSDTITGVLTQLGLSARDIDLMLDLGLVTKHKVTSGGVAQAISRLPHLDQWRRLIVAGSVIPSSLGQFPTNRVSTLPRDEWVLWIELTQMSSTDLPRLPIYSDYGIQSPEPPVDLDEIDRRLIRSLMHVSIRYTTEDNYLIARGGKVSLGPDQYVQLCKKLSHHSDFKGAGFSAGDKCIAEVAKGTRKPGDQRMWRMVGASHHMELVCSQLDQMRDGLKSSAGR
jgi:hypothetical protein